MKVQTESRIQESNASMPKFRKVSILIPVYNEQDTLEKIISAVKKAEVFGMEKEIIIIDDKSTDKSREILCRYRKKHKIILHEKNLGKGSALKSGMQTAIGDIIIIQDADLEYDPNEYVILLKPIISGKADVVYGSRFAGSGPHRVLYFWHYLGNKFLTTLSNMFTNLNLTDMETCYKVFTKEIIDKVYPNLQSSRFGFEPEITARIAKLSRKEKCRIFEVGISYSGRTYSEGKKINWKDGVEAIWCIIKYNLFS
jgi:glycosyltransferase involved in cell wall biosynthesis